MAIRTFHPRDLVDVSTVDREAFGENGYSFLVLRQLSDISGDLFLVYENPQGLIVGFAVSAVGASRNDAWLLAIGVAKDWRRHGVGLALLTHVIGLLRSKGIARIQLTVEPSNDAAIRLYDSFGFRRGQVFDDYYGPGEKRVAMWLSLT